MAMKLFYGAVNLQKMVVEPGATATVFRNVLFGFAAESPDEAIQEAKNSEEVARMVDDGFLVVGAQAFVVNPAELARVRRPRRKLVVPTPSPN